MAENEEHHVRRHSSRKPRPPTTWALSQPRKSVSSPSSPAEKRIMPGSSSRGRQLWNHAVVSILEQERVPIAGESTSASASNNEPVGWYNLTKRVMQLNASPMTATAADPALHKENWQHRRYNFLSKYSMFGGELKDDVVGQIGVNEQGTEVEQRPIIAASQLATSGSLDVEASNAKRESILGMAVSGVRNLLTEDQDQEQPSGSNAGARQTVIVNKNGQPSPVLAESVGIDEHDGHDEHASTQCTRTETDPVPATTVVTPRDHLPRNGIFSSYFRSRGRSKQQKKKLAEIEESYHSHRPYFTYWVTFVQILVCTVSLLVYGHAPMSSRQSNNATLFDQQRFDLTMNPWFGPHPADLIRLGAKYTPCMRTHDEVTSRYDYQARIESMSGCCIDSTTDRCMQTLPQQCLSRSRLKWYRSPLTNKNVKGQAPATYPAVCGLTPETCTKKLIGNTPRFDERSWLSTMVDAQVFKWSPDAVQWPICLEQDLKRISHNISLYPYMQCTNIARPCCTGVLGDCVLTSKDDCRRRRGIFHPRAHLCSQVDCIQSVCGMLEFFVARLPDQVYRFWTVIFLHAGLIHLLITVIFQYTIMRPLEKLAGCIRVMIIYIVSGFVGSLASALFLRDFIQVGPGGGQFAILACYLSELLLGWRSLKRPWIPFFKIIVCLLFLFAVGLLPLVDNYSQCFGFLTGFMLNMIIFPDVSYKKNARHLVVVTATLAATIALFIVLITLFYTVPFKCASCKLFDCPPGQICGDE